MNHSFPVAASAVITGKGQILLGKKEEKEDHPMSGEWHFPGGHVEKGEELEETLKREVEEETGLEVEIHHMVDAYYDEVGEIVRVIYHCEADEISNEAASDDLEEIEWVKPGQLEEKLKGTHEAEVALERGRIQNLIEKLKKMPNF